MWKRRTKVLRPGRAGERESEKERERERERDGGRGSFGTKILAMLAMSSQPQTLGVSVPGASASIFLTV